MQQIDDRLNLAAEHHQRGQLDQAQQVYEEILTSIPHQADALHLMGVIAYQKNQPGLAIRYMQQAIDSSPNSPLFHENLGKAYLAQQQYAEAATSLETALQLKTKSQDVYSSLVYVYERLQLLSNAIGVCEKWCQYTGLSDTQLAEACYTKANLLRKLNNNEQAEHEYRQAIDLMPSHRNAHNNLGNLLQDARRFDEAVVWYRRAISLDTNFSEAHNNLGTALKELEHWDVAEAAYRQAIRLCPENAEYYFNLANLYRSQGKYRPALFQYDQVLTHDSKHLQAAVNRATTLKELKQLDAALAGYDAVLKLAPHLQEARFNRSLVLLMLEQWQAGWEEHECRGQNIANVNLPTWPGPTAPIEQHVLVRAEQGIGDEIMFASCLGEMQTHVNRCTVECDPRLITLFSRSFPELEFVNRHESRNQQILSRYAAQIFAGSLPRYFRNQIADFPKRDQFLTADITATERWKRRYASLPNVSGPVVGISWKGGQQQEARLKRSNSLENWRPIFQNSSARFINLQYGETDSDLARVRSPSRTTVHSWSDANPLTDLDDFAAQISALDLVISIDNSTVHMAGALGIPVWTMIPWVPDWRWGIRAEASPWYPTMRLIRQQRAGAWDDVTQHIAGELEAFCKNWESNNGSD